MYFNILLTGDRARIFALEQRKARLELADLHGNCYLSQQCTRRIISSSSLVLPVVVYPQFHGSMLVSLMASNTIET